MSDLAAAAVAVPMVDLASGREVRRLGSKANEAVYKTIINQIPPHHTYIEPFLGWGAIMLNKAPAALSICLDRESDKVSNFLLELTTAQPTMAAAIVNADDVLWAGLPGRLGKAAATSGGNGDSNDGAHGTLTTAKLPRVASIGSSDATRARSKANLSHNCALIVGDAISFLAKYPWRGDELVYCDPPYVWETRTSRHRYLFEMDTVEHTALLDVLSKIPAKVMVSGYHSGLYEEKLRDWRLVTFEAITRGGTMRTEHLWCNFPAPVELHDYRYLGRNFRERQDIKRMKARWLRKLASMPTLKRQALLAAIQQSQAGTEPCGSNGRQQTAVGGKKRRHSSVE